MISLIGIQYPNPKIQIPKFLKWAAKIGIFWFLNLSNAIFLLENIEKIFCA